MEVPTMTNLDQLHGHRVTHELTSDGPRFYSDCPCGVEAGPFATQAEARTHDPHRKARPVGSTGAFGVDPVTPAEQALADQVGAKFYAVAKIGGARREFLSLYVEPRDRDRVERATTEAGYGHSSIANAAGELCRIDVLRSDVARGGTYVPDCPDEGEHDGPLFAFPTMTLCKAHAIARGIY
jgi:hypothetical protein